MTRSVTTWGTRCCRRWRDVWSAASEGAMRSSRKARREACRRPDKEGAISRLGGDEFVLILSEIGSSEDAANVARRIAAALSQQIQLGHDEVTVTASIGISVYPHDASNAETLLKHADAAMYHAKEQGRNSYRFYTEALNERTARRFAIEFNLRRALERGEFVLFYQPRIDIRTQLSAADRHPDATRRRDGSSRAMAATGRGAGPARRIHPGGGGKRVDVPIGEWVLQEACRQAAVWSTSGLAPLTVSVNMSAGQFKYGHLVDDIRRVLQETGLDPGFWKSN